MIKRYIESPNRIDIPAGKEVIFLAGGITGVENWQIRACEFLHNCPDLFICNPRRRDFDAFKDMAGFEESKKQIEWEFEYLEKANQILFWFGKETVQPIVLFELGTKIRGNTPLFIGAHPEYPRRFDLIVQAPLYGYTDPIFEDLNDLLRAVANYNHMLKRF